MMCMARPQRSLDRVDEVDGVDLTLFQLALGRDDEPVGERLGYYREF
jgi:hypothetical protein